MSRKGDVGGGANSMAMSGLGFRKLLVVIRWPFLSSYT